MRPAERGLHHRRRPEAVTDGDRRRQPELAADGHELGPVLLARAALPRRRAAAGPAPDADARRAPAPAEVEAFDERVPRRVIVLEPMDENEVGAGPDLLHGDLGVTDGEPLFGAHVQIRAALSTTWASLAHCSSAVRALPSTVL